MSKLRIEMMIQAKGFLRRIKLAQTREDYLVAAKEADSFCQFCIGSSQLLMTTAREIEEIEEDCPACRKTIRERAEGYRKDARGYTEIHSTFQEYQKSGKIPTSLPFLEGLGRLLN